MVTNVLAVNPERLWDSLEQSAAIGRFRDVGLRRLALSAEDKQMRDLFVGWARSAGCSVEIDRLGNIFARRAGTDPSLPPAGKPTRIFSESRVSCARTTVGAASAAPAAASACKARRRLRIMVMSSLPSSVSGRS